MEKDLPGPLLLTNDEVVDAIKNIDKIKEQYKDRNEEFYTRFCCVDDGHAAKWVVWKQVALTIILKSKHVFTVL